MGLGPQRCGRPQTGGSRAARATAPGASRPAGAGTRGAGAARTAAGRPRHLAAARVPASGRAARVGAGTPGPMLEDQLKTRGLTARFYPQSFERSTLGGWVATRAAGHFATRLTHIDDLVESVRAVTPTGLWESRRLPGSGAGPSPDRMLLGSEGSLGVITEAWIRVQPRPTTRWAATLGAATF